MISQHFEQRHFTGSLSRHVGIKKYQKDKINFNNFSSFQKIHHQ